MLLAALLFAPGLSVDQKMYAVVHGVCAQQHNITLGGLQLPMCARNTGVYASVTITLLFLLFRGRSRAGHIPPISVTVTLIGFVLAMAVDGFNSAFLDMGLPHLYTPRNDLRTLTGLGMGVALAVFMLLIMNVALRKNVDDNQPVLSGWGELGAVLLLNFGVLVALYGNLSWLYWPIAIIAWVGITGQLYIVNILMVALLMGYEGKVTDWRQLARPGTIALGTTLLMLFALAAGRFWMEAHGMVV